MTTRKVSITGTVDSYRVVVDGVDLAPGLSGLNLQMGAGQIPELALDVRLYDVTEIQDIEARVIITPGTHDALVALGWTPPPAVAQ